MELGEVHELLELLELELLDEFDALDAFEVLVHREGDEESECVISKDGVHALRDVSRVMREGTDRHGFNVGLLWRFIS